MRITFTAEKSSSSQDSQPVHKADDRRLQSKKRLLQEAGDAYESAMKLLCSNDNEGALELLEQVVNGPFYFQLVETVSDGTEFYLQAKRLASLVLIALGSIKSRSPAERLRDVVHAIQLQPKAQNSHWKLLAVVANAAGNVLLAKHAWKVCKKREPFLYSKVQYSAERSLSKFLKMNPRKGISSIEEAPVTTLQFPECCRLLPLVKQMRRLLQRYGGPEFLVRLPQRSAAIGSQKSQKSLREGETADDSEVDLAIGFSVFKSAASNAQAQKSTDLVPIEDFFAEPGQAISASLLLEKIFDFAQAADRFPSDALWKDREVVVDLLREHNWHRLGPLHLLDLMVDFSLSDSVKLEAERLLVCSPLSTERDFALEAIHFLRHGTASSFQGQNSFFFYFSKNLPSVLNEATLRYFYQCRLLAENRIPPEGISIENILKYSHPLFRYPLVLQVIESAKPNAGWLIDLIFSLSDHKDWRGDSSVFLILRKLVHIAIDEGDGSLRRIANYFSRDWAVWCASENSCIEARAFYLSILRLSSLTCDDLSKIFPSRLLLSVSANGIDSEEAMQLVAVLFNNGDPLMREKIIGGVFSIPGCSQIWPFARRFVESAGVALVSEFVVILERKISKQLIPGNGTKKGDLEQLLSVSENYTDRWLASHFFTASLGVFREWLDQKAFVWFPRNWIATDSVSHLWGRKLFSLVAQLSQRIRGEPLHAALEGDVLVRPTNGRSWCRLGQSFLSAAVKLQGFFLEQQQSAKSALCRALKCFQQGKGKQHLQNICLLNLFQLTGDTAYIAAYQKEFSKDAAQSAIFCFLSGSFVRAIVLSCKNLFHQLNTFSLCSAMRSLLRLGVKDQELGIEVIAEALMQHRPIKIDLNSLVDLLVQLAETSPDSVQHLALFVAAKASLYWNDDPERSLSLMRRVLCLGGKKAGNRLFEKVVPIEGTLFFDHFILRSEYVLLLFQSALAVASRQVPFSLDVVLTLCKSVSTPALYCDWNRLRAQLVNLANIYVADKDHLGKIVELLG